MAEKVVNDPLTGEEIILAIVDRISTALRQDCFMAPHTSYDYYEADITVRIKMNDSGLRDVQVDREFQITVGEEPDGGLDVVEAELVISPKTPNEERVLTGQPVPVLSKDNNGRTVTKHIKYARSKAVGAKIAAKKASRGDVQI